MDTKKLCLNCKQPISKRASKFCSTKCQQSLRSKNLYKHFLEHPEMYNNEKWSPRSIKKHILSEQNNKCSICSTINKWRDAELIFIIDHIDGNSANNTRSNLRLICPNCDSQLPTYKSKNLGNGRHFRTERRSKGKSF